MELTVPGPQDEQPQEQEQQTPQEETASPAAPRNLTATVNVDDSVTLTWDAAGGRQHHRPPDTAPPPLRRRDSGHPARVAGEGHQRAGSSGQSSYVNVFHHSPITPSRVNWRAVVVV